MDEMQTRKGMPDPASQALKEIWGAGLAADKHRKETTQQPHPPGVEEALMKFYNR